MRPQRTAAAIRPKSAGSQRPGNAAGKPKEVQDPQEKVVPALHLRNVKGALVDSHVSPRTWAHKHDVVTA